MSRANLPAIPETAYYDGQPTHMIGGLTIRERFAMAAMQGMHACDYENDLIGVAQRAVKQADALIAELDCTSADKFTTLALAVQALLPAIDSEIDQRKTGGNDEDWLDLQRLVDNVREALP